MRSIEVTIAGESIDLPVSFAAGLALSKAGLDPLVIASRARQSELPLNAIEVVDVLATGAKLAKSKLSREQIGDAVFEGGVNTYMGVAVEYLSAFVVGPEHPMEDADPKG